MRIHTQRIGSWCCAEAALALCAAASLATAAQAQLSADALGEPLKAFRVGGDAVEEPFTNTPGDAALGRAIVANRQTGLCLLCHSAPIPEERFQGEIGPDLRGAGVRWTAGQLRLRLADGRRINSQSIMPAYYRVDGLTRVGSAWRGQPLLSGQQIEDVVAYLGTLRD